MRVWGSVGSNLQHPASKYWVLQGTSDPSQGGAAHCSARFPVHVSAAFLQTHVGTFT